MEKKSFDRLLRPSFRSPDLADALNNVNAEVASACTRCLQEISAFQETVVHFAITQAKVRLESSIKVLSSYFLTFFFNFR